MYFNIVEAKYLKDYRLELTFEDGEKGVVDFKEFIDGGGVYTPLVNIEYFKSFFINETICWKKGDIDVAPETLYYKATGKPWPEEWVLAEKEYLLKHEG